MKHRIILTILALILTFVCSQKSFSQEVQPKSPAETKVAEAQLADRFVKILDEELEKENICLSFRGGILIERVIRTSVATINFEKSFDKIPEAERNLRIFAQQLRRSANTPGAGGLIRITFEDMRRVLSPRDNKNTSFGVCPLFPICK